MALGVIGLPVPDETILVLVGILVANHRMDYLPAILAATVGSSIGITISYIVGSFVEYSVTERLIRWMRISGKRFHRLQEGMKRYGGWLLFLGYFIPGVRQLTAIVAGLSEMRYVSFALPAYAGAILWTGMFITLGRSFGRGFHRYYEIVQRVTWELALAVVMLAVIPAVIVYFRRRRR